jgi:hypothetical protein
MFKLVFAAILLMSAGAQAFQLPNAGFSDQETRMRVADAYQQMRQEPNFTKRYEHLLDLEKFVNNKVQTVELPDFDTVQENDPILKNYTSLNEFDNNLELVKQNLRVPNTTCASVQNDLIKTSGSNSVHPEDAPETYITLQLVRALCGL